MHPKRVGAGLAAAVVGRSREDRGGAVELLGEHDAGEHVRPDHAPEGEPAVGAVAKGRVESVGAADREGEVAAAGVGGAAEKRGEARRVEGVAAFVEGDEEGAGGDRGGEERRLGGRPAPAAVLDLDDPRRPEPEGAAGAVEAGEVVGDEVGLGAALQASDGEEVDG